MKKSAATIVAEKEVLPSIEKNLSAKKRSQRKHKHIVVRSKIGKKQ